MLLCVSPELTGDEVNSVGVDVGWSLLALCRVGVGLDVQKGFLQGRSCSETSSSTRLLLHKPALQHGTAAAGCGPITRKDRYQEQQYHHITLKDVIIIIIIITGTV